jgi:hypothetical protein
VLPAGWADRLAILAPIPAAHDIRGALVAARADDRCRLQPYASEMAIFKRRQQDLPQPMSEVLLQGHDMIERTAAAHAKRWGLGTADSWVFDGSHGTLQWTFSDHSAEAAAQILGSWSSAASSWRWAWANDSLPNQLRAASETVRDWGHVHEQQMLTMPTLEGVDEHQAGDLAAIAFRLTRATGFYRAPSNGPILFMTFGPVSITTANGSVETFTIVAD